MAATVDLTQALGDFGAAKADRIELQQVQQTVDALRRGIAAETDARQQAVAGEGGAREAADTAEAQARQAADAAEAQARATAIAQEQRDRGSAIDALSQQLGAQISGLGNSLRQADADEARLRADAVAQQGAALSKVIADQRFELIASLSRPGDAPICFTTGVSPYSLGGETDGLPFLPSAMGVSASNGGAVRIVGSGLVATRRACPLEPGRAYRVRWVIERRANPSDPANDAVQIGLVFLDQTLNIVPGQPGAQVIEQIPNLVTGDGRQERSLVLARASGPLIALVAPASARYVRAYVRTFGPDGVTDVEVLGIDDITDATVFDPVSADALARIGALENLDPGPRLDALEQAVSGPNTLTFRTKGEAASSVIPVSITTVRLLAGLKPGDGLGGEYVRVPPDGRVPPNVDASDTFVSSNDTWAREYPADVVISTEQGRWLSRLPVSPPDPGPGWWNNSGVACLS